MSAGGRSGTEDFKSYADVQAALDREYVAQQAGAAGRSAEGTAARNWWYDQQINLSSMVDSTAAAPSGGGGGGGSPAPPAPPPAPLLPTFVPITSSITAIKQAPIDTVVFNEDTVSIQQLTELLYEQIGGMELINIAREDTVSGQDVIYSPISNISSIWGQFNPNNVIAVGSSFDTFFSRFAIDLILRGMNIPYFNEDGDLIIEIDDVLSDEEIHYQIASSGTINEVDI